MCSILFPSFPGHRRFLLPSRIWGKGDVGDHDSDGPDVLHEHGVGHDAAVLGDAAHRHLLLMHHDHGGDIGGEKIYLFFWLILPLSSFLYLLSN